jgi:hypothetical protein
VEIDGANLATWDTSINGNIRFEEEPRKKAEMVRDQ